jgi:hypothetical protein
VIRRKGSQKVSKEKGKKTRGIKRKERERRYKGDYSEIYSKVNIARQMIP